jgi:hypothetical protein
MSSFGEDSEAGKGRETKYGATAMKVGGENVFFLNPSPRSAFKVRKDDG